MQRQEFCYLLFLLYIKRLEVAIGCYYTKVKLVNTDEKATVPLCRKTIFKLRLPYFLDVHVFRSYDTLATTYL